MSSRWRAVLTGPARDDFIRILDESRTNFGTVQAGVYKALLTETIAKLRVGPDVPGSKELVGIPGGYRSLHVARRSRHLIVYRPSAADLIEVVRILHDRMDVGRHLPPNLD